MNIQTILDPERWARETFGASKLKDIRRTGRAVQVGSLMAKKPSGSLPAQMHTWKGTMALYRLLDEEDVTFEALMQPHWEHTCEQIEARPAVLLVQDTTDRDLTSHPKTSGVGEIGNGGGRGLFLQTVLALVPETGEVLGCAQQESFVAFQYQEGKSLSEPRNQVKVLGIFIQQVENTTCICRSQSVVPRQEKRNHPFFS